MISGELGLIWFIEVVRECNLSVFSCLFAVFIFMSRMVGSGSGYGDG